MIGGGSEKKKGKTSTEINRQIHHHPLNFVYGGYIDQCHTKS